MKLNTGKWRLQSRAIDRIRYYGYNMLWKAYDVLEKMHVISSGKAFYKHCRITMILHEDIWPKIMSDEMFDSYTDYLEDMGQNFVADTMRDKRREIMGL